MPQEYTKNREKDLEQVHKTCELEAKHRASEKGSRGAEDFAVRASSQQLLSTNADAD